MCSLKGPFLFIILSLTLNSLEATPVERLLSLALSYGMPTDKSRSDDKGDLSNAIRSLRSNLALTLIRFLTLLCISSKYTLKIACCVCCEMAEEMWSSWCVSLYLLLTTSSHHLDKRKCNTATCVTQRLADFLVRSSNTIGAIYSPTNVGSNTYGKRGREPPNYLQL
ncbi:islet amyloid polypeptide [Python bivittatus]|uniref:Islet amyloid polypeptide n=1 Tax=Python bivittatus TaxID=176946 RepID=A0A9F5J0F9_PYTBI|nr:islet amyloid polypeptide [Python bivittatus]